MTDSRAQVKLGVFEKMFCGFWAGAVGKSSVAPFQRVQIVYQVNPGETLSAAKAINTTKALIAESGIPGLWRGNLANCGRSAPTAAIKFYTQSAFYGKYTNNTFHSFENSAAQFLSGASSGIVTVASTYPMDLFRTKMAANSAYKGYADCFSQTVSAYGVKGLFHGISAPIVGSIPHTGIAFWTYDFLKTKMGVNSDDPTKQSPVRRAAAGFLAGFAGQTVTYPFSTVRRRMQTSIEWKERGLVQCFIHTTKTEGVRGLYRAYSIHAFKGPVSAGLSFAMNDIFKNFITNWKLTRLEAEDQEDYVEVTETAAKQA